MDNLQELIASMWDYREALVSEGILTGQDYPCGIKDCQVEHQHPRLIELDELINRLEGFIYGRE